MQEAVLIKISLACSIIGLISLFFLSESTEPTQTKENDAYEMIGKTVVVEGSVASIKTETAAFIDILDLSGRRLNVVAFKTGASKLSGFSGRQIKVIGTLENYNDKPEIIASEISLVQQGAIS